MLRNMRRVSIIIFLICILLSCKSKNKEKDKRIGREIKSKTSVAFIGEYNEFSGPCMQRDDMRVRYLISEFLVKKDYQKNIKCKSIAINIAMIPESDNVLKDLREGEDYIVLLNPSTSSMAIISDSMGVFNHETALRDTEIIAIFMAEDFSGSDSILVFPRPPH